MFVAALVLILSVTSFSFADIVAPCPGTEKFYDSVRLVVGDQECTVSPCQFVRGKDVTATIAFTTNRAISEIHQKVNATALGITTPFPLPNANKGCDFLDEDHYCPLDPGENVEYNLVMPVLEGYPKVALILDFYLEDQSSLQILCFEVKAQVVDA